MRRGRALLVCLSALAGMTGPAAAEKPKVEYASCTRGRRISAVSRVRGPRRFCMRGVARPDPGVAPGGVVVILGRTAGTASGS